MAIHVLTTGVGQRKELYSDFFTLGHLPKQKPTVLIMIKMSKGKDKHTICIVNLRYRAICKP